MDEDVTRILNCVNCCWPEIPFTHNDIRRPTGEKFRELLRQFLKSFIVGNYQLPNVLMHLYSRNPEMYSHLEGNISLLKEINQVLLSLHANPMKYGDLIRPTPGTVKDVLVCLVNFLAYFEAEENTQESIENEIIQTKQQMMQNEKRLNEEQKHLDKCKMSAEEKKIQETELRQVLVNRKEKCMKIEAGVKRLETEVDEISKRMAGIQLKIEQSCVTLKQVEAEKEKAAEAVVADPEALEAELQKSHNDKETLISDFMCLKARLPILEQQIQEKTALLSEHKDMHQRLTQFKDREAKIKAEWKKAEAEYRRVEEEGQALKNQKEKETSLNESKKRMLDEFNLKVEQLSAQLEKARSDLQQSSSAEEARRVQLETRLSTVGNDIARLKQEIANGQKALEEGAAVFEALKIKHQQNLKEAEMKFMQEFAEFEKMIDARMA